MSEVSLVVLVEAGKPRHLACASFQLVLPDALLWGPEALPTIEEIAEEVNVWPPLDEIGCVVAIDKVNRRIVRAGSSFSFDTPYELELFQRMVASAWKGYRIEPASMTRESLENLVGDSLPETDNLLARRLAAKAFPGFADDEDEDEYDDEPEAANDFRRLMGPDGETPEDGEDGPPVDRWDEEDESSVWVSVRYADDDAAHFKHYSGSFVWETLASSGPDLLDRLHEIPTSDVPEENETFNGIVLDAVDKSIGYWSFPRGPIDAGEFGNGWSDWTVEPWLENGFRRQLEVTGATDFIPVSDTAALASFVPMMAEQTDLEGVIEEIRSSVRSCSRRSFGCLALVLAVPASLAWLVSGSWEGPFAFAFGLWLVAYVGYRVMLGKIKRGLAPITEQRLEQEDGHPQIAPEEKEDRVAWIDSVLTDAKLPSFEQITFFAEVDDEDE